ncbi:purine-binding chemotaxis protein CheW [Nitrospirillum amazonense]|uniref:Purine-binding chemotaxis protein CheW n=1 Tax=Nitrospirillum amazonense TaxID=28077 RepID=A0A560F0Y8_9PROT|nr:chemotaxis protein CheW [Nitrospirillum amazonense]TWB15274.1 purine-binding chemotaxis protein CheW [Nitrospirillum amazonense]
MNSLTQTSRDAQFVTLGIEREIYAVPVEAVVEILDMRPVFRIPETPPYLVGLIDVRGRGVPVIDLRLKLGLSPGIPSEHTRILVLHVPINGRDIALGLIADRVFEVLPLDLRQLEGPPDIGVSWRSDYIRGVGRRGDGFVIVFDLTTLFTAEEASVIGRKAPPDLAASAAAPPLPAAATL